MNLRELVGRTVLFMDSPESRESHPFLVLRAGDETLDGVMWPTHEGSMGIIQHKEGVRHVTDPKLMDQDFVRIMREEEEGGVFVLHPFDVARDKQLASLAERLSDLEESLGGPASGGKTGKSAKPKPGPKPKRDEPADEDDEQDSVRDDKGNVVNLSDIIGTQGPVDPAEKAAALAAAGHQG